MNRIVESAGLILLPVLACVVLFLIAYLIWPSTIEPSRPDIRVEFAKTLAQLGSITILGGFLAALLKFRLDNDARRRDIEREQMERRSALLNDFITRTGNAYREAKSCRRRLRTVGHEFTGAHRSVMRQLRTALSQVVVNNSGT